MIVISDVYNCLGLDDPDEFKSKIILRNADLIEKGEMPACEILRQTGRTQKLIARAITYLSIGAKIAIYAHNRSMGQKIKQEIINTSNIIGKATGVYIPLKNIVITTPYSSMVDLKGHNIDIKLYDAAIKDIKMKKSGFYIT